MIPFSSIELIISTVKCLYVNDLDVFTVKNKTATINDVATDKSCACICLHGME